MPYDNFLQTLNKDNFKREIISQTLCFELTRANCAKLLSIVVRAYPPLKLIRRLSRQTLIRAGENNPTVNGMSYNSARDELFFADNANNVVRAMRVRDNADDLRDSVWCRVGLYTAQHDTSQLVWSVCHMSESDTLLVC